MSRFDRLAREWDLKPQRVESAKNVTKKIKSLLSLEGMDVLDYGAGTGLITFNICEDARTVVAMDNAKKMLEEIDKKAEHADIDNVYTRYHDINHETLPHARFDLFISSMTMHHVEDTEDFLQKAKSSLVEGGYLAINDLESEDGSFHSMGNEDVAHFGFEKEKIRQQLEDMGMEIVFLETIEVITKAKAYPIFLVVAKNV
jgi:2-polyprenyl-3-methyl-5-hydroxy-6-metoxy-1,4-benzoquinol methylase